MLQTTLTFQPTPNVPATREAACARMQRIVKAIAREACRGRKQIGYLTVDDLAATGMMGVLQAFEHFDPSNGVDFEAFARYRVRGAILDAMRAQDTVSRRRRGLARELRYAEEQVSHDDASAPSARSVADAMGMDLDTYWKAVASTRSADVVSLDAPVADDTGAAKLGERIADDTQPEPSDALWRVQAHAALHEALATLPARARDAVVRYYLEGTSQANIAADHGVTVSRISQILSGARNVLRDQLASKIDRAELT